MLLWAGRRYNAGLTAIALIAVQIPRLLLDAKPDAALQILRYVASSPLPTAELDAAALAVIQPVAMCPLATAARSAQCAGKQLVIRNASQKVRLALADLTACVELQGEGTIESWQGPHVRHGRGISIRGECGCKPHIAKDRRVHSR